MTEYAVEWYIDIDAETPEDAARQALAIHRDPSSIATVFSVFERDENGRDDDPVAEVDVAALPETAQIEPVLVGAARRALSTMGSILDREPVGDRDLRHACEELLAALAPYE